MKQPAVTRYQTLALFTDYFQKLGIPIESRLRHCGLPALNEYQDPLALVPVANALRFVGDTIYQQGLNDVVCGAVTAHPSRSPIDVGHRQVGVSAYQEIKKAFLFAPAY